MIRHPATFSPPILDAIDQALGAADTVLDPFAGVGGIHKIDRRTVGIELEPEWARQHRDTLVGNALALPFLDATFDAVATSPCYGNRMADHHNAKDSSVRHTYKHTLCRDLSADNAGAMQWGKTYRSFHWAAWAEAIRTLRPDGLFILNISDHIRGGKPQGVHFWHVVALSALGLMYRGAVPVSTRRQRHGANGALRVESEWVVTFNK